MTVCQKVQKSYFQSHFLRLKINILKGIHCIWRIQGAPVRQKLGMILENKAVQKLKLENMFFTKNGLPN